MSLEQYVTDLCAKLRSGDEVKLDGLMDMPYRHLMASVLSQHLTGPATAVVEGLLNEVVKLQGVCESLHNQNLNYKEAHQASIKELEAMTAAKPIKPKRVIQSAPKVGKISKKKIEAAVKGNKDAV